ncbi:substrate-binding domain-containing protein [Devosia sp. A8/3-2]|nr:substrate-binding domain-containing protein [Devosia sp. A8/3-2]
MLASGNDGVAVVRQPWSLGRRIAIAAITFVGLGFLVFATAGSNAEGRLMGAGSTLVQPILQSVSTAYQGYIAADRVNPATREGQSSDWAGSVSALDYDPVGSIGGLVRLDNPAVHFAATEVPMTVAELAAEDRMQFPLILGAAAPVVNLDLPSGMLTLDADVLAAIYAGTVTNWNDPAIAALNGATELPDLPIAVRHRREGSGTTYTFTGYLAKSTSWTAGRAAQLNWPVGEATDGSSGMVAAVAATEGAIGYAEIGRARRAGLTVVNTVDGDGVNVAATPETIAAAATGIDWSAGNAAITGAGWPMTAIVYVVTKAEKSAQTDRALAFFRYFYAEAPRRADELGYVALPPAAVEAVEGLWASHFEQKS